MMVKLATVKEWTSLQACYWPLWVKKKAFGWWLVRTYTKYSFFLSSLEWAYPLSTLCAVIMNNEPFKLREIFSKDMSGTHEIIYIAGEFRVCILFPMNVAHIITPLFKCHCRQACTYLPPWSIPTPWEEHCTHIDVQYSVVVSLK